MTSSAFAGKELCQLCLFFLPAVILSSYSARFKQFFGDNCVKYRYHILQNSINMLCEKYQRIKQERFAVRDEVMIGIRDSLREIYGKRYSYEEL